MISAHETGIPQKRERVFLIGVRKPHQINFSFKHSLCGITSTKVLKHIIDINVPESYYLKNKDIWQKDGCKRKEKRIDMIWQSFNERKNNGKHQYNPNNTVLAAEINGDTPSGRSRQTNRVYHYDGLAPTLTTVDIRSVFDGKDLRSLTEREYATLQGFPKSYKINKKYAYKQFGNAVCVNIVKHICKEILQNE